MSQHKQYLGYKMVKAGWLKSLPEHWGLLPLKAIASVELSNVDKKSADGEPEVQLCNYVDVYKNEKITREITFMQATASAQQIQRLSLEEGDVLLTKDSESPNDIGVPSLVAEPVKAVCGYHLALARPNPDLCDGGFLAWFIRSQPNKAYFETEAKGLTRYGIDKSSIKDTPVAYPPLLEQQQIKSFLDRETTRIDTLIAKKTRFIDLLKEKRQAVITQAVTKGLDDSMPMNDSGVKWLGMVPAHWETSRMANIFREAIRPGDPALPILSISIHDGITDDEVAPEDRDRRASHIEDRTKYKRVAPNDLAYNMMRAWQGAFGAVTVDGLVSPAYVVAEPMSEFRTAYIENLLRTPMATEEMRRYSRGIADFRMRLYWDYFRDLKVCLPPLAEQDKILDMITRETSRIDRLTEKTQRSIELLKEHRTALITAAVTGKIDVREAA